VEERSIIYESGEKEWVEKKRGIQAGGSGVLICNKAQGFFFFSKILHPYENSCNYTY
jgi:hypothetical protein